MTDEGRLSKEARDKMIERIVEVAFVVDNVPRDESLKRCQATNDKGVKNCWEHATSKK